ncbi:hypothetical protein [Streptosporangium sp. NPDC049046]|uniref:hypothetical protein n=1 Tax=unclassified Streptosporangium TaxID=2632669 RepID=UPI00341C7353
MKIRRLRSAVLAVALGAGILVGTATQTGAASGDWPTRDWYKVGPFPTLAECDSYYDIDAQSGLYSGLVGCRWLLGGSAYPSGYYYEVYIP